MAISSPLIAFDVDKDESAWILPILHVRSISICDYEVVVLGFTHLHDAYTAAYIVVLSIVIGRMLGSMLIECSG